MTEKIGNKEYYIVPCRGHEYVTESKYYYEWAMEIEDTPIHSQRRRYIINHHDHFKLKSEVLRKAREVQRKPVRCSGDLYLLLHTLDSSRISDEDEQYIEDLLGPDPFAFLS